MADFDSGGTTVGSIVGYLKIDKSDWDAKLAEAKRQADDLGADSPDVRIRTNAEDVAAELEAVRVAAAQVDGETAHVDVEKDETTNERTVSTSDVVSTGGADAAAKIDSVTKAQDRLAAARDKAAAAAGRVEAAEATLTAAESKYTAAAEDATRAEDASWRAQQSGVSSAKAKADALDKLQQATVRVDAAAAAATRAEVALANAQRSSESASRAVESAEGDVTAAIAKRAAAEEAAASATAKENDSSRGQLGYYGAIAAAIGALLPLAAPLASVVLGGSAAFGVLGIVGVAAVAGIRSEMAEGTTTGAAYSAGVQSLTGDMDELKETAADGVLTAFQSAVSAVNAEMPTLNSETSQFAQIGGQIGGSVIRLLITGFNEFLPLIHEAADGALGFSQELDQAAQSPQFRQFIAYMVQELPEAGDMLGALVGAVLHLLGALAPIGTIAVPLITDLADVIEAIPTPVLTTVAGAVVTVAGAFGLWKVIGPMVLQISSAVDLLSGTQLGLVTTTEGVADAEGVAAAATVAMGDAMDFALGPVGLILGAVGALAIGLFGVTQANHSATEATQSYTAAVEADNGAIGANVKAQAAKQLASSGALTAAKQLGISTQVLTNATLGNSNAQQKLGEQIDAVWAKVQKLDKAQQDSGNAYSGTDAKVSALMQKLAALRSEYDANASGIRSAIKSYNDIAQAQGLATISSAKQLTAQQNLAASYGVSLPVYLAAVAASKKDADQTAATTAAMQLENNAAGLLNNALDLLNGGALGVAQAQTSAASAANSAATSFKTNGAAIDGSSAAAVSNQQAIQQSITAIEALGTATGTATGSTEKSVSAMASARAALEAQLQAQGSLTPAVQAYIDKLLNLNAIKVKPTQIDLQDNASAGINAIQGRLNAIPRVIDVQVNTEGGTNVVGGSPVTGGLRAFATGGAVEGPGSATSDSINARLSDGEHVLDAGDVSAMGGQRAVYAFRAALHSAGTVRVGANQSAPPPMPLAQPSALHVVFTDATTGGVMALIKSTVRQVNASDGRMHAIQNTGGSVR